MKNIKAIAVDMDGTFLNDSNDYDRETFQALFEKMREQAVKFIVASGNQYAQLQSFFPGLTKEITFVSENGALVFEQDTMIRSNCFAAETAAQVIQFVDSYLPEVDLIVCSEEAAYIKAGKSAETMAVIATYYFKRREYQSNAELPIDKIVKFALGVPKEKTDALVEQLRRSFKGVVEPVSSGHGSIDLIIPGVNKGTALQFLLDRWQLSAENLAAFGDGNNDIEMLKLAGHGYAMASGGERVKAAAAKIAPTNQASGVLTTIAAELL